MAIEVKLGEIIAYRLWRLDSRDLLLYSPIIGYKWIPGEVFHADSVPDFVIKKPTGKTFHEAIQCAVHGIYASKYRLEPGKLINSWPIVSGKVALWGKVIEHEHGYRAEHARIISIDNIHGLNFSPTVLLDYLKGKYFVKDI